MLYETDLVKNVSPQIASTASDEIENTVSDPIGYVTVHVDRLRVRRTHSTTSAVRGEATNGERYQVYETYEDDDYTWYRIGTNRWIAGTDESTSYEAISLIEADPAVDAPAKTMELTVIVDNLNIRSGAGLNEPIVSKAVNGKTYTAQETVQAQGYTWYRIGEDQWIAGNPDWIRTE